MGNKIRQRPQDLTHSNRRLFRALLIPLRHGEGKSRPAGTEGEAIATDTAISQTLHQFRR